MKRYKIIAALSGLLAVICFFSAASADRTLTLTFTGDVTLGGEEYRQKAEDSFNKTAERKGYDYFFRNFREMFENDDCTIINLEGVLSDNARQENRKKTYRFRGPTDYTKILTGSSVEGCTIANNHTLDFGEQGYKATAEALRNANVGCFGNGLSWIFEKDGLRIGFFGLVSPKFEAYKKFVAEKAAEMRADGVNAIVVCVHAGNEYSKIHNRMQENYAKYCIEKAGADLVIMHHPHVLQGITVMNNRYVCYSLGNFCFGGNKEVRKGALYSMVVQAEMTFADDGTYKGQRLKLYPAHMSGDPEKNNYQPCPVSGKEADEVFERVRFDSKLPLDGILDDDTGCMPLEWLPAVTEEAEAQQ